MCGKWHHYRENKIKNNTFFLRRKKFTLVLSPVRDIYLLYLTGLYQILLHRVRLTETQLELCGVCIPQMSKFGASFHHL